MTSASKIGIVTAGLSYLSHQYNPQTRQIYIVSTNLQSYRKTILQAQLLQISGGGLSGTSLNMHTAPQPSQSHQGTKVHSRNMESTSTAPIPI